MQFIYNLLVSSAEKALPLSGFFSNKMKLFIKGQKKVFPQLESKIQQEEKYIWIHAASLGEFEQAVPVMEMLTEEYPKHQILVSFFSPSGYENKKKHPLADLITYLPLDTRANAQKFLDLVHPELVFFIKYDIWPNFMKEIGKRKIRSFLISGSFRENQIYFKPYGKLMLKALQVFEHIFVQNQTSFDLLQKKGFKNVSVSGDTRFDRVSRQLGYLNKLEVMEKFLQDELCLVAGSTWPEDEELLVEYINTSTGKVKFVIAPHEIKAEKIKSFRNKLKKANLLFSETLEKNPANYEILIIDNIGLLSKVYSYADIAYVGGAAGKTGLHNILEPATFGVPIIIGENYSGFPEAISLEKIAGLFPVSSPEELSKILDKLIKNKDSRKKTGMIAGHFVSSNTGATRRIQEYLQSLPR